MKILIRNNQAVIGQKGTLMGEFRDDCSVILASAGPVDKGQDTVTINDARGNFMVKIDMAKGFTFSAVTEGRPRKECLQ